MAFKFKTFAAVGALIGSLALVGCGQDEKDPNHIKVGVIVGAEQQDRKSTRLNSSHSAKSRMPSSA